MTESTNIIYKGITCKRYNSNNKLVYHKDMHGYEEWYDYDGHNNLIHYKTTRIVVRQSYTNGTTNSLTSVQDIIYYEQWYDYNDIGQLVCTRDNNPHNRTELYY